MIFVRREIFECGVYFPRWLGKEIGEERNGGSGRRRVNLHQHHLEDLSDATKRHHTRMQQNTEYNALSGSNNSYTHIHTVVLKDCSGTWFHSVMNNLQMLLYPSMIRSVVMKPDFVAVVVFLAWNGSTGGIR